MRMSNNAVAKIIFLLAGLFLFGYTILKFLNAYQFEGWLLMAFFMSIAIGFRQYELLKGYSFTVMIFAAVSLAMYYPQYFIYVGDFKLSKLIVPLMQIIMFGMGTGLSVKDFAGVVRMPKGVLVGVLCHYIIMPLVAFSITKIFHFPDEVAAGIIRDATAI